MFFTTQRTVNLYSSMPHRKWLNKYNLIIISYCWTLQWDTHCTGNVTTPLHLIFTTQHYEHGMIISLPLIYEMTITTTYRMTLHWSGSKGLVSMFYGHIKNVYYNVWEKIKLVQVSEYQNISPWDGRGSTGEKGKLGVPWTSLFLFVCFCFLFSPWQRFFHSVLHTVV